MIRTDEEDEPGHVECQRVFGPARCGLDPAPSPLPPPRRQRPSVVILSFLFFVLDIQLNLVKSFFIRVGRIVDNVVHLVQLVR